ncbi:hypothetical protein [Candidatus Nitrotoga sp. M5]|uniref:hypothetical protein n=1 Tax=Candidatus Nitrotoga sp. M5 TaxID=2890409 RepID=UPI001EF5AF9A|nr:hypothetical protein [Candidatus Nitrotoga sp. M5]CAH1388006.1 conserved hypothetical protein [Candidatus Nitrotoga sp. M5]
MNTHIKLSVAFLAFLIFLIPGISGAQEVLLDEMQEAGDLKLFPVYGDKKKFYYISDKIKIPKGENGKPQFSFLKFVEDAEGSGEGGVHDAQGGGLVHFLINFDVDDQTVQRAQAELQRKVAGAEIVGPIMFREGTFALVSNFQQEDGDWTKRVLGLGKAPVLEGHKAAVSIRLTKTGAILLWESFQQAASDISVSFDMIISGYRNPYEAKMTAWWDRIASNKSLAIGARTDFLGVDIQDTMKELRDSGAIELEVKGENDKMDRLWEMVYGKLAAQMFEPNNDPTTLATLQDDPNVFSNFDRANQFNTEVRERIQQENQTELDRVERQRQQLLALGEQVPFFANIARNMPRSESTNNSAEPGGTADNNTTDASDSNTAEGEGGSATPSSENSSSDSSPRTVRPANLQTPPSFSILASYRKKQFKKTGKFELSFKSWTPDTQSMRFDENIGGFGKKMFNDPAHFRVVNLDDPAYKNREILVQLDGQNSADFNKFVNFVTVQIRKKHQDGFLHVDELKIDRENFIKTSNNFVMNYGVHGDTDREKWLEYDYHVTWNLFGGAEWKSGWKKTNDFMIPVTPPYRYREVTIEADPEVFRDEKVRLTTIVFKSKLFGKQDSRKISLKTTSKDPLSQTIKYAHEPDNYNYEYDISWLKRGGVQVKKNDVVGDADFIFADELPE